MREIEFAGRRWSWSWWSGQRLRGTAESPAAFDTETELVKTYRDPLPGEDPLSLPTSPLHVPRPSLGIAFDGTQLFAIHPSKFARFFTANRSVCFVAHNVAFDFWAVHNTVDRAGQQVLWEIGDRCGYCDTMLLDMLLQLATGKYRKGSNRAGDDTKIFPTDLGTLSAEWGCGQPDKDSPYRLRFGEWLGLSESEIDVLPESAAFMAYALGDVIATHGVYREQRKAAVAVMRRAGWSPDPKQKTFEIRPDALQKFGPLSEYLQVKSAIVLAELSRTPLRIDQKKRAETEAATRDRYRAAIDALTAELPDLIKRSKPKYRVVYGRDADGRKTKERMLEKPAEVKYTKQTFVPQMNTKVLAERLTVVAADIGVPVPLSKGKTRCVSTSSKVWAKYADADESGFVRRWIELEREAKLLEFLTAVNAPAVYSNYSLLKRTGRTSAGAHRRRGVLLVPSVNVQQMPREDPKHPERSVRSLFLPPEGTKWFSCDYSYIELVALASVCKARFGWSKLAEAVADHRTGGGVDPHQRTAAAMARLSVEDFLRLPKEQQKTLRQSAKAVNFARPAGLGDTTFLSYAKASYGVDFTRQEAKDAKKAWLETYSEIRLYLEDRTQQAMEWQTGRKQSPLGWLARKRLSDFLRAEDAGRKRFPAWEAEDIWDRLETLAYARGDEATIDDVERRKVTTDVRSLVYYRACTLAGRVRNNVKYTDNCNTPFQGSAADGAKEALWRLMRRGFRLLGFVHDAVDIAVDPKAAAVQCRQIEKVMVESMEYVLGQGVPVGADGLLSDCWAKG